MATIRAIIADKAQIYVEQMQWQAAISELEKLFLIDPDPLVRVRIGNVHRKLNSIGEAIKEYVHAADMFAEYGFIRKALAQYGLVLKLDASNEAARRKRDSLQVRRAFTRQPGEYGKSAAHI
ncbi:MAG TPA: hypothetical protein VK654_08895 [Nitrospirota bacterium]|nr:hypothetical protein [Nitrospirota bacterium]